MEVQWALVLFTVVSGCGAWSFAWAMLSHLLKKAAAPGKLETIVAFILVALGGCISVLHLKHVDRILEALNRPTSGIFVEAAFVGVICVILAVYLVMLARGSSEKSRMVLGVVGMVACAVFTYACGSSYMMDARPVWATVSLPVAYFGTAAAAGAGLNLALKAYLKAQPEEISFAGAVTIAGSAIGIVCAGMFCLIAAPAFAGNVNGASMWVVCLFVTLVVELALGVLAMKKPESGLVLGIVAVVVGIVAAVALRCAMWCVGTPVLDFFMMPLG